DLGGILNTSAKAADAVFRARARCPGLEDSVSWSARLVGELVRVGLGEVSRLALVACDELLLNLLNRLGAALRHLAIGAEDRELALQVGDVGRLVAGEVVCRHLAGDLVGRVRV